MGIMARAEKKYSEKSKQFSFETWEDELHITFDGEAEPNEENDYDVSREIQVDATEFNKRILLIADVPTLQATVYIKRDSWNTYSNASITIRGGGEDTIILEIDMNEYVFEKHELVAIMGALV